MPNFSRPVTYFCLAAFLCAAPTVISPVFAQEKAVAPAKAAAPAAKPAPKAPAPAYRLGNAATADSVQVEELPAAAAGLQTTGAAGLRDNLWDKVTYEMWDVLLNNLPPSVPSPVLNDLLSASMLSTTPIPAGDISPAAQHDTRTNALMTFVTAGTFSRYLTTVPAGERTPLHALRQRELFFLEQGANACKGLPVESATVNDMLWRLYCTLANTNDPNRLAEAQLQLDILRERGTQTSAEVMLADAILAHESAPDSSAMPPLGSNPTVLTLRLLGLNSDMAINLSSTDPLVMRMRQQIMLERGGAVGADAAEWLAARGFIDADTLRDAYEAVSFNDIDRTDANIISRMKGAQQRAYLWQQLVDANGSDEQLRLLNDFVAAGGISALLGTRGEILAPYLAEIPASPENAWAAPSMFALAASQGVTTAQNRWYDTATSVAETLPDAQKWLTRQWPLALALQLTNASTTNMPNWIAVAQTQAAIDRIPVADVLTILEAAGFAVPSELWATVTDTPTAVAAGRVNMQQLDGLRAAAAANDQGQVILRAVALLNGDVRDVPPPVTAAVIRALADVELPDAARRLTIEALLNLLYPSS